MKQDIPAQVPAEFGGDAVAWAIWLYYGEGRTQSEVASALRLSRATIANYLAEGRRRGLVSIEIAPELLSTVSLARALCERWNLASAHVIPALGDMAELRRAVGRAGGHALARHMRPGAVIGVAWGRTVGQLAVALPERQLPEMSIVQVSGSSLSNAEHSPEVCTALIASRTGARAENLHAPALLSTPEMRDRLAAEPGIARQLARTRDCDVVLFGVGELDGEHVFADPDYMSAEAAEEYMRLGAVGILLGRCIDPEGNEVEGPLSGRRMGMELPDLRAAPARLCVAGGMAKIDAIRAALRGGYVTEFVTDAEIARSLLEEERHDGKGSGNRAG
ncbi:sugar-binding transcriptional regulator [Poseidonocella sp. HB161398]|uniref:sugar-binding transcriptional regulator n=1 Tax=Poseidonocella sp. HB161398 TaxID=2320855 RepID=UPI001107D5E8|nr:sugar-binding transcriptional regulator [Poseidonocella sp. HB161398]